MPSILNDDTEYYDRIVTTNTIKPYYNKVIANKKNRYCSLNQEERECLQSRLCMKQKTKAT